VYSVADGSVTRLTDGPSQSVKPVWSPDDLAIVHGAVTLLNFEASGNGYNYTGVWSAAADGSEIVRLSNNELYGFEEPAGWLTDREVLLDSFDGSANPACQYRDLRAVDIRTGETQVLWAEPYFERAFDPVTQTMLIAVIEGLDCDSTRGTGIYYFPLGAGTADYRIVEDEVVEITWDPVAELFFATTTPRGALAIDVNGQFIDLAIPKSTYNLPAVAPGSRTLAWTGHDLWIGTLLDSIDQPPRQIHPERVRVATWSPDGDHLLYFAVDGFFVASAPAYDPQPISAPAGWRGSWVFP
jgi:hypothetical protein